MLLQYDKCLLLIKLYLIAYALFVFNTPIYSRHTIILWYTYIDLLCSQTATACHKFVSYSCKLCKVSGIIPYKQLLFVTYFDVYLITLKNIRQFVLKMYNSFKVLNEYDGDVNKVIEKWKILRNFYDILPLMMKIKNNNNCNLLKYYSIKDFLNFLMVNYPAILAIIIFYQLRDFFSFTFNCMM